MKKDIVDIKIIGIGGGGCNAVNRLINEDVEGVEFIAANTDMVALNGCNVDRKIQLGGELTKGLGAGSIPNVGEKAAQESQEEIIEAIQGANLLFLTAGMGGGTGTGGIPIVAAIARKLDILTIAVVTKPFEYEGRRKMELANEGIEKLKENVDVLVVIPNEMAFKYASDTTPFCKVVQIADKVLQDSIIGITDIVVKPSLINLDFADIRTVISNMKTAHIGIGKAKGENRVLNALKQAANSPLLESTIEDATQIIVNITADMEVNGLEIKQALSLINQVADIDANIIQGIGFDETLKEEVIVTLIATGFNHNGTQNTSNLLSKKDNILPIEKIDEKKEKINIPSPVIKNEEKTSFEKLREEKEKVDKFEKKKDNEEIISPVMKISTNDVPPFLKRLRKGNKN